MKKMISLSTVTVLLFIMSSFGQNASTESSNLFDERYRPQFHYTTVKGWINDPIGLVYYQGEYHLFNDHNPFSCQFPGGKTNGEQSHWSHAISTNLVHWKHMPIAVVPDALGACWSGSGIIDWNNTAGFQTGEEKPLVLIYTSAGKTFGQSLVFSNDQGRTWKKYSGNPVFKQIAPENRDPKVFWHEPTGKWVMALYLESNNFGLFSSPNLKDWTHLSDVQVPISSECPDLFELRVDSKNKKTKWVFWAANGNYLVGSFDGQSFTKESGPHRADHGTNFYAAQTWSNIKGRRIQIAWMRGGKYPDMPFNQQMSFPCELTLCTFSEGIRLCRNPVKEIKNLYTEKFALKNRNLSPGENPLAGISGELFDLQMEIEPKKASEFGIRLYGQTISYADKKISCLGNSAPVLTFEGRIKLRILVDRTSLEVFANDGEVSMTSCFLQKYKNTKLELYTKEDDIYIRSLKVFKLKSVWETD